LKNKRVADIPRWIAECVNAGLIADYEVDGKRYLEIVNFNQPEPHGESSFPPSHDDQVCHGVSPLKKAERKFSPLASPLLKPNKENKQQRVRACEKIFFAYEGDGKIHGITEEQLKYWVEMYPGLNVEEELRRASAWLDANRKNRKYDVKRFLVNWLGKAQDRARVQKTEPEKDYTGL
jgi:hypothetical protein